jgi:phosphoesterase RecJ-like protein
MEKINKIIEELKKVKKVALFHHIAPDGDSLGSALALREMIEQLENVEVVDNVITSYVPEIYKFLPQIEKLKKVNDPSLFRNYDFAICLDCASKERLGDAVDLFNNAKKTVCLDHHLSNKGFASINLIDPYASSTGEVVYRLIKPMGISLTKGIATNIYTAILTDTGGFKFESTKPETFRICAKLIEHGADLVKIYTECYETKPLAMVKLHAKVIDQAVLIENNQIVYGSISRNLLDEMDASDDYIDGITESLRQIKDVRVAIVFKETLKGTTRVSLRSNGIDVCQIAGYFGGGGHKLAAGCLLEKNIEEAIKDVISLTVKQLDKKEAFTNY